MEGFKIKLKAQDIDFELEIEKIEDEHIDFVRDIIRMVDKKTTSPLEKIANDELKEKYMNAARAYKTISEEVQAENEKNNADTVKKVDSVDNYVALEVEEELKEEADVKQPVSNRSNNKVVTKEEMVESHKHYFKNTDLQSSEKPEIDEENLKASTDIKSVQAQKDKYENITPYNNFGNSNSTLVYSTNQPVNYSTQLKDTGNGFETTYQTYYICTNDRCRNKGKHYIPEGQQYVTCHKKNCKKKLKVKPATLKGFPHKDKFGNYYVAGKYKPQDDFDYTQHSSLLNSFQK
ncbi:hypothetical protein O0Q50_19010 [Priestia aryabhattai]|uniref:Uncharacterized protein n=1 Tax=Priestia aryabhattai TaxID=412384 RepID=A0AAX6NBH4_PRIAR|nr:hypothetical protein [Priestia aryabhattai]MDU9693263.1 hypothetical protein [Priestia aryabhattai]